RSCATVRSPPSTRSPPTAAPATLSLHDALPIFAAGVEDVLAHAFENRPDPGECGIVATAHEREGTRSGPGDTTGHRSVHHCHAQIGKHTSELQSRENLVCRLLLEKKKTTSSNTI